MDDVIKFPPISKEKKREMKIAMMSSCLRQNEAFACGLKDTVVNEVLMTFKKEQDRRLEYALRYLIPHPIKGAITKAKVRYRGLYLKENQTYNQRTEMHGDTTVLVCTFLLPNLCGRESRSGKRKAFELSLGFQDDTLHTYQLWCRKIDTIMFGCGGRNFGKTAKRYQTKGIIEQIRKGN